MLILAPLLIPLTAALLAAVVRGRMLILVNLTSALALLYTSMSLILAVKLTGTQSLALGAWPLPYAIEFSVDGLSAALILVLSLVSAGVLLYMTRWQELTASRGLYPLVYGLVAASMAVSMAADLFNLYVWFELMLITVLGLLTLGGKPRHLEAAFKYFTLNMLGTLLLLAAIGLIHGASGQLNFSALHNSSANIPIEYLALFFAALLLKVGAFPLYAWLPAAYHTLPAPLLALVGGFLTKITLYVILRLSGQVFDITSFMEPLGWLAMITMLSGVIGAAYHWDIRRILAFHIVSQIGYLLMGIALASPAAAAGTSFFLLHNILVKANLFLLAGLIWVAAGHYDLRRIGGLYKSQPLLAGLFLLSAFSLVGVPPSSGFWGKYLLVYEAFVQDHFIWAGIALATGLLTLYSMSKIWLEGFWKPYDDTPIARRLPVSAMTSVTVISVLILLLGLFPQAPIDWLQHSTSDFWRP
jgi:multicomponent Na+:H+ antiporter subunit D